MILKESMARLGMSRTESDGAEGSGYIPVTVQLSSGVSAEILIPCDPITFGA